MFFFFLFFNIVLWFFPLLIFCHHEIIWIARAAGESIPFLGPYLLTSTSAPAPVIARAGSLWAGDTWALMGHLIPCPGWGRLWGLSCFCTPESCLNTFVRVVQFCSKTRGSSEGVLQECDTSCRVVIFWELQSVGYFNTFHPWKHCPWKRWRSRKC